MDIGARLRKLRNLKQVSQFNLEVEANFAPGTVSRFECNKTNPTKETIFRISEAMNLDLAEILFLLGIDRFLPAKNKQEFSETWDICEHQLWELLP